MARPGLTSRQTVPRVPALRGLGKSTAIRREFKRVIKPTRQYKFQPGPVTLRQRIKQHRKSLELIPKDAFAILVREVIEEFGGKSMKSIEKPALEALLEYAECMLVSQFEMTKLALLSKRVAAGQRGS
ncbi:MAG: hypothetical protein Q9191_000572 [Dirinaria sp. TL-2023a]